MGEAAVLPDAELLLRQALGTDAEVTALVPLARITTQLPEAPTYPCVTLQRIGGRPPVRQRLDQARVQVDCWATTRLTASTVARTVRAACHRLEGFANAAGVITGVEDEDAPRWLPDTSRPTPTPRFVFTVAIYTHPA